PGECLDVEARAMHGPGGGEAELGVVAVAAGRERHFHAELPADAASPLDRFGQRLSLEAPTQPGVVGQFRDKSERVSPGCPQHGADRAAEARCVRGSTHRKTPGRWMTRTR